MSRKNRILVTITPPTPNGGIHLGHLAGPFLAADVFARAQRQRGHETLLVCYSDDYQSYLARKARELGEPAAEVSARFADDIEASLALAGVQMDGFMRARANPVFQRVVAEHFELLRERGAISRERRPVAFCGHCQLHGYEAYARGHCNLCGALSDASQCESCAGAPAVEQMRGLFCTQCKRPSEWREEERLVLDLGRFRETLGELHAATPMRPPLQDFIARTLQQEDLRWPISRPHEHGIPVQIDGREELLHTWFSGLAGYRACSEEIAARRGQPELVDRYWASPDTVFAHFLGFDCSFSHAVVYRAILSALPEAPRRAHFYTNAFLKLDNEDFSTSRGHAIWARDLLQTVSADLLRQYLCSVAPETEACNFSSADFARWQPLAEQRLAELLAAAEQAGGRDLDAPVLDEDGGAALQAPLAALRKRWLAATALDSFSVRALAATVDAALDLALLRCGIGAADQGLALAALAGFARATMPALSDRLLQALGLSAAQLEGWLLDEQAPPSALQPQALPQAQQERALA